MQVLHVVAVSPQPDRLPCRFGWALQDNYSGAGPLAKGAKQQILQATLACAEHPEAAAPILFERGYAPRLRSGDARLSLAHSGSWLLAGSVEAAGQGMKNLIGVDVEQLRPRNFARLEVFLNWQSGEQVLQRAGVEFSSATSQQRLTELFYRRWTLAEALYKAHSAASPQSAGPCAKADFRVLEAMAWQTLAHSKSAAPSETVPARESDWMFASTNNALGKCEWQFRWQRVVPTTAQAEPTPAMICVLLGQTPTQPLTQPLAQKSAN